MTAIKRLPPLPGERPGVIETNSPCRPRPRTGNRDCSGAGDRKWGTLGGWGQEVGTPQGLGTGSGDPSGAGDRKWGPLGGWRQEVGTPRGLATGSQDCLPQSHMLLKCKQVAPGRQRPRAAVTGPCGLEPAKATGKGHAPL